MKLLIALLVVTVILLILYCCNYENMTKIYSGVGIVPGIGPRGGAIVSDDQFTYFDGAELQPCDMCPNPIVCPKCPNNSASTMMRNINEGFTGVKDMAMGAKDALTGFVGKFLGRDNFLSRPWYKTSVCDSTGRGDYYDTMIYSPDTDFQGDANSQASESPPLDGQVGHVAQVHINPSSEHCVRYNELRPEIDYSKDPVIANYSADFGANRSRIVGINEETIRPYMGPVTPVPFDADAQYWAERERVGAAYTKLYGRPNFSRSAGMSSEPFLTQPDEAFEQNRNQCDPDYKLSCGPAACGDKQLRNDILCCKIPSEKTTINLLYNEVMGLPIDATLSPEKCELIGMNGYGYQEDCIRV
jgi:hypothetical protein